MTKADVIELVTEFIFDREGNYRDPNSDSRDMERRHIRRQVIELFKEVDCENI